MAIKMLRPVKPETSDRKAEDFIKGAGTGPAKVEEPAIPEASKAVVNMRFDSVLLERIDAAARRLGISRTAWLHVAAAKALE